MDEAKITAAEERIDLPERTDASPWTATILALLQDWGNRAAASASTHYLIAGRLAKYNVMLGVPVVMFTTFVGTSVFATLQDERSVPFAITVGMVSVAAAVLASLQTFLRFSERAEKHRVAATRWGAIRREIALMIALHPTYPESRGDPKKYLDNLRERMDKLSAESPEMGERTWTRRQRQFGVGVPPVEAPEVPLDEEQNPTA
jgi:hypothetical protein